jgi:RimJ/RimL family protein N-acetyltransferase
VNVELRKATHSDIHLMVEWYTDPRVSEGIYALPDVDVIPMDNFWWLYHIIMSGGNPVGTVITEDLCHWCPELRFYIGVPDLWSKGIGRQAVSLALDILRSYGKKFSRCTILDGNDRAMRLVRGLWFERLGKARPGESWWQAKL